MKLDIDIPEELQKPHFVTPLWMRISFSILTIIMLSTFVWIFIEKIYNATLNISEVLGISIISLFFIIISLSSFQRQVITVSGITSILLKKTTIPWEHIREFNKPFTYHGIITLNGKTHANKKVSIAGPVKQFKHFLNEVYTIYEYESSIPNFLNIPTFIEPQWPLFNKYAKFVFILIMIGFYVFDPISYIETSILSGIIFAVICICFYTIFMMFSLGSVNCTTKGISSANVKWNNFTLWQYITAIPDIREVKKRFLTWYEMDIETRDGIKTIRTANSDTYPKLIQVKEIFENWQKEQA